MPHVIPSSLRPALSFALCLPFGARALPAQCAQPSGSTTLAWTGPARPLAIVECRITAPAGSQVLLLASTSAARVAVADQYLCLGLPLLVLGQASTDAAGRASLGLRVPAMLAGTTLQLQAAAFRNTGIVASNRAALPVPAATLPAPAANYVVADGGYKDTQTGLVWSEAYVTFGQFADVKAAVDALVLNGFDDWRLPSKDELLDAHTKGLADVTGLPGPVYSGTTKGKNQVWLVDLTTGQNWSEWINGFHYAHAVRGVSGGGKGGGKGNGK